MIYVSNFASMRPLSALIEQHKLTPVSIAAKPPHWFKGKHYESLAPDGVLLHQFHEKTISEEAYFAGYAKKLAKLDPRKVFADLNKMNAVMLCWCSVGSECHRYHAADWLNESNQHETGVEVEELHKGLFEQADELFK